LGLGGEVVEEGGDSGVFWDEGDGEAAADPGGVEDLGGDAGGDTDAGVGAVGAADAPAGAGADPAPPRVKPGEAGVTAGESTPGLRSIGARKSS